MSKEKNKNTFRIGALLLVACLISSVMLSGTFAKYTSEYAGKDTALVAKWSLDIKQGDDNGFALSPDEAADLHLFLHEYNTNILANAGTQKIIAPGVSGNFVLNLANNSDVAAEIDFVISEDGAEVPIEFGIGDDFDFVTANPATDILYGIGELEDALNEDVDIELSELGGDLDEISVTVYWRWAFERGTEAALVANDAADTNLGITSVTDNRTEYKLTITVTATQLAPTVTP